VAVKLHIGCFDQPAAGWINTDITPHIWIARVPGAAAALHRVGVLSDERYEAHKSGVFRQVRYQSLSRRFRFADGSVDAIFASHVLEHLARSTAENVAKEAHRVLRVGGVLRIAVPDLDRAVEDYQPEDAEGWFTQLLEADQRGKNRHQFMYNEVSLTALLARAGFRDVQRRAYREGSCPDLELIDNRPESLFVEATR
jgi:predicted SAM-dependent methyltransferase